MHEFTLVVGAHDALEIEMQKIEADAEYKIKEKVDRAFITRFECEEREEE
jgi:hypothetical protein